MATLNVNGQRVTVDDSFLKLSPEQQNATVEEIAGSLKPAAPEGFMANAMDLIKSIPRGLVKGATSAQNPSFVPLEDVNLEMAPIREGATKTLVNQTYAPQGPFGKGGEAIGEGLGNPISYVGPGSLPLKVGASVLSSAAGEAGAQGAEALGGGQGAQTAARLTSALVGGATAAKMAGGAPKAAAPTKPELKSAANSDYKAARESGLELDPRGPAQWAAKTEQELSGANYGHTGGPEGTAPKTFGALGKLQNPPGDAVAVSAGNLDAIRKNLALISRGTAEGKPTPDAQAATVALKGFNEYLENIPTNHIVAGNAAAYVDATKRANANYGAYQRTRNFDSRIVSAEDQAARQIAGSADATIKNKSGALLDKAKQGGTGLSQPEIAQLQLINSGGPVSNTLRQLGRGGAGVIPLGTQAALALATGGTHVIPQATLAAALYGARKTSEAITKSRASKLAEMLAQRSPLFEQRKAGLPAADTTVGTSALLRALLGH